MAAPRPATKIVTRRQLGGLLALVMGVSVASRLVRPALPAGRDLSGSVALRRVLADRGAPVETAPGADVTMVAFTDYRCPACRVAAPAMAAAVAADGQVRVIWRDWPIFGPVSERAARVALAAAMQGIYPAVHRRLMAERRPLTGAVLLEAVADAGGDGDRLRADLRRHRPAIDARLARNAAQAVLLGLPGTPAWLIGDRLILGAIDADAFAAAFAAARGAVSRSASLA